MAISSVRTKINGIWTILSYNEESDMYEGSITAPVITSFNMDGGYYPVTIEVENDAGTVTTKDNSDPIIGSKLRLVVKERVKPVITLESPTDGAYIQNNIAPIIFMVSDEVAGSGIKESSIFVFLDGFEIQTVKEKIENGYRCTYYPESPLMDGRHMVSISVQDNDENMADSVEFTYTIDSVPPTLNLFAPTFSVTNDPVCVVSGVTNDETSSPVTVHILINGEDTGDIHPEESGGFYKEVALQEGDNTITITSTDSSGRETKIERVIKLDTTIPEITSINFEPNPVDTSQLVRITLQVK